MDSSDKKAYLIYVVIMAVVIAFAISTSGCTSINNIAKKMTSQEVMVKMVVANRLHASPEFSPKVKRAADSALLLVNAGEITSLDGASTYMMDRLKVNEMLPEEREFVIKLVQDVRTEVMSGLTVNGITDAGKETVELKKWLEWFSYVGERETLK